LFYLQFKNQIFLERIAGLAKLLSSSSSITMALLLPVALVFFSPILLASLFFIVPALIFSIACVIIPACFVIPTVLSVLFIFDLLMPNKYSTKGKSFASRINIFNRAAKPSGNKEANSDDIRATIAYQQTKVH
jgi:predicted membrane protein